MKTSALCILKGKEEQMLQEPVGTRSFFEGRLFVVKFVFVTDFSYNISFHLKRYFDDNKEKLSDISDEFRSSDAPKCTYVTKCL